MSGDYGIINEQGFPAGQFGFDKVNDKDKKAIDEAAEKEKQ